MGDTEILMVQIIEHKEVLTIRVLETLHQEKLMTILPKIQPMAQLLMDTEDLIFPVIHQIHLCKIKTKAIFPPTTSYQFINRLILIFINRDLLHLNFIIQILQVQHLVEVIDDELLLKYFIIHLHFICINSLNLFHLKILLIGSLCVIVYLLSKQIVINGNIMYHFLDYFSMIFSLASRLYLNSSSSLSFNLIYSISFNIFCL